MIIFLCQDAEHGARVRWPACVSRERGLRGRSGEETPSAEKTLLRRFQGSRRANLINEGATAILLNRVFISSLFPKPSVGADVKVLFVFPLKYLKNHGTKILMFVVVMMMWRSPDASSSRSTDDRLERVLLIPQEVFFFKSVTCFPLAVSQRRSGERKTRLMSHRVCFFLSTRRLKDKWHLTRPPPLLPRAGQSSRCVRAAVHSARRET